MLNHAKLVHVIEELADQLFVDRRSDLSVVYETWQAMIADPFIQHKLPLFDVPWHLPAWQEALSDVVPIVRKVSNYTITAIDGSQIYPDRHHDIHCFLVNVGIVKLQYQITHSEPAYFQSIPYLFTQDSMSDFGYYISTDIVNCIRQEYEFSHGLQIAKPTTACDRNGYLVVFDGSLIFWHLESKDPQLKQHFLLKYFQSLNDFYYQQIPFACYISYPKGKDIAHMVRAVLHAGLYGRTMPSDSLHYLIDSHIVRSYTTPATRTTVFKSTSPICALYPVALHPHFFYMNTEYEIARVEIPAWIAHDIELVDAVATMLYDQIQKGYGYPVVLSEAHEQAVVHGADRDLFYYILQKVALQRERPRDVISCKLSRKKRAGF